MKIIHNTDGLANYGEDGSIDGIECISLIGTKMYFTIQLLPVFLKQIDIWVIFLSFIVLMSILDPTKIIQHGGYGAIFFIWFCMATIYTGLTISTLTTWYFFLRYKRLKSVILPINSFIIVYALIFLYPYIERLAIGYFAISPSAVHIRDGLYFFAIEQVFITLYVTLGFPLTVRNLGLEKAYPSGYFSAKPKASQPNEYTSVQQKALAAQNQQICMVQIGAQKFNAKDICYFSAEEHYVRVGTVSEEILIRDRFSQVVPRFEDGIGFQVHRSHWVAFSCVQDMIKRDKHHKIQLQNGELIPISEARRHSFQESLLLYRRNGSFVSPL